MAPAFAQHSRGIGLISTDRFHHKMADVSHSCSACLRKSKKTSSLQQASNRHNLFLKPVEAAVETEAQTEASQHFNGLSKSLASIGAGLGPVEANLCSSASVLHAIPPASLHQATWWGFVGDTHQEISKVGKKNYRLHKGALHKA